MKELDNTYTRAIKATPRYVQELQEDIRLKHAQKVLDEERTKQSKLAWHDALDRLRDQCGHRYDDSSSAVTRYYNYSSCEICGSLGVD